MNNLEILSPLENMLVVEMQIELLSEAESLELDAYDIILGV